MAEHVAPQLVPLEPAAGTADLLQVQYRGCGAETTLRGGYGRGCGSAPLYSVAMIDLNKVRNSYIACGYTDLRSCATALTGWPPLSHSNLADTWMKKACSCSAAAVQIELMHSTGLEMAMFCCSSGCPTAQVRSGAEATGPAEFPLAYEGLNRFAPCASL